MNKLHVLRTLCGVIAALPVTAFSAPLDALLTADQYHNAGELRAEASYDAVNSTLDVFNVRAKDPQYAGTTVGDYSGLHFLLGYALTDRLSLEGGLWRRKISYRSDDEALNSWQMSGQYRVWGNQDSTAHFAVRLSAWGDQAGSLTKSTPTQVEGHKLDSVTIDSPSDSQVQVDAIGTWRLTNQTSVSTFVGTGHSTVKTGDLSATTSINGCNYNLAFTSTEITGHLSSCPSPTPGVPVVEAFSTSQNVLSEFSYQANYYQLGGMMQWQNQDWTVRGGYQFQKLQRSNVDALIVSRGGVSYQTNNILVADVTRKVSTHLSVFVRGQVMSNQFVGEIPFIYNSVTASKFSGKYGFASFGMRYAF
jgi:hypothetical protein